MEGDVFLRVKKVLFGLVFVIMSLSASMFLCEAAEESYMVTPSGVRGEAFDVFDIEEEHYYIIAYTNKSDEVKNVTVQGVVTDNTNWAEEIGSVNVSMTVKPGVSRNVELQFSPDSDKRSNGRCSITVNDGAESTKDYIWYNMKATMVGEKANPNSFVNTHIGQNAYRNDGQKIIDAVTAAGFGGIRDSEEWENVEWNKGKRNFAFFTDRRMNSMAEKGLDGIFMLGGGNSNYAGLNLNDIKAYTGNDSLTWDSARHTAKWRMPKISGTSYDPTVDTYMKAYLDYVSAVVTRYKGKIKYYGVWNEPNIKTFNYNLEASAADYGMLCKLAAQTVKSIDPDAKVIGISLAGAASTNDIKYIREALAVAKDDIDGIAVHPYDHQAANNTVVSNFTNKLNTVWDAMQNVGFNKELWITELGWYTITDGYTEEEQARRAIITQTVFDRFSKENGNNGKYIWYDMVNDGNDAGYSENNYGLLTRAFIPKQSYYAYSAFNDLVENKPLIDVKPITTSFFIGGYSFEYNDAENGLSTYVIYDIMNKSYTLDLSKHKGKIATVYNMYGDITEPGFIVSDEKSSYTTTLTDEPIYVNISNAPTIDITDIEISGNDVCISGEGYDGAMLSVSLWAENANSIDVNEENAKFYVKYANQITIDEEETFDIEFKILETERRSYKLIVSDAKGNKLTRNIVVGDSIASVRLLKDGIEIGDLSDADAGDNLQIDVDYYGVKSKVSLIFAEYYESQALSNVEIFDVYPGTGKTIDFEPEAEKSYSVLLWNNLSELVPLYEKKVFK